VEGGLQLADKARERGQVMDSNCLECGGISTAYHNYTIEICVKCAKKRIDHYFRGVNR
jgi:hypothetical protein